MWKRVRRLLRRLLPTRLRYYMLERELSRMEQESELLPRGADAEARICAAKHRPPRAYRATFTPSYEDLPLPVSAKERERREAQCKTGIYLASDQLVDNLPEACPCVTAKRVAAQAEKDKDDGVR